MQASWLKENYSIWVIRTLSEIPTHTEFVSKGVDLLVPSFCIKDSEPPLSALLALRSILLRLGERWPQGSYIHFLSQQCLKKERNHGSVLGEGKLFPGSLSQRAHGPVFSPPTEAGSPVSFPEARVFVGMVAHWHKHVLKAEAVFSKSIDSVRKRKKRVHENYNRKSGAVITGTSLEITIWGHGRRMMSVIGLMPWTSASHLFSRKGNIKRSPKTIIVIIIACCKCGKHIVGHAAQD